MDSSLWKTLEPYDTVGYRDSLITMHKFSTTKVNNSNDHINITCQIPCTRGTRLLKLIFAQDQATEEGGDEQQRLITLRTDRMYSFYGSEVIHHFNSRAMSPFNPHPH